MRLIDVSQKSVVIVLIVSDMTHCNLVPTVNSSLPIEIALEMRYYSFMFNLNSNNLIIKSTSISVLPLIDLSLDITINIFVINIRFQEIHDFYQFV